MYIYGAGCVSVIDIHTRITFLQFYVNTSDAYRDIFRMRAVPTQMEF